MSSDVMFAAGAVAMLAVALLLLLPPLMGRGRDNSMARKESNLAVFEQRLAELKGDLERGALNESDYEQAEADLKRELLSDLEGEERQLSMDRKAGKFAAIGVLVFVPLVSFGIYHQIGSPDALDIEAASTKVADQQEQIAFEQVVAQLEQKLEQNPNNAEGWLMLVKSYRYLGKSDHEVINVYRTALERISDDPDPQLLLEYGELLAQQQGNWEGEPLAQLQRALEIDPNYADGLWFFGHVHFEMGKYQTALEYWQRLAKLVPSDAEAIEIINQAAAKAQQKLGLAVSPLIEPAKQASPVLAVKVSLSPSLADRVSQSDAVFVYAKALGRRGPPLAAQRITVADLPITIKLDDSMAVMPGNNLSNADQIEVGAKISKSGVATGGKGDLVGTVETTTGTTEPISITIDRALD